MTTLPQSTMIRPHKAASAGAAAPAGVAQTPASAFQMTPGDVWRVVRGNFWLIAIFVVIFAAAGYGLNYVWAKYAPQYTATGLLRFESTLLEDPITGRVSDMSESRVATRLKTEANMLKTEQSIRELLMKEGSNLRSTRWFKQFLDAKGNLDVRRAIEDLSDRFNATPLTDSDLLIVSFKTSVPDDCKTVLEEIVNEYLKRQKEYFSARITDQRDTMRAIRDKCAMQAQAIAIETDALQKRLALAGMGVPGLQSGSFGVKEVELRILIDRQYEATGKLSTARSMLENAKKMIANNEVPAETERRIDNDPLVMGLMQEKMGWVIQKKALDESRGSAPRSQELGTMINEADQQLKSRRDDLRVKYRDQYITELEAAAKSLEVEMGGIAKRVKELQDEMGEQAATIALLMAKRDQEKTLRDQQFQADREYQKSLSTYNADAQKRIDWAPGGMPQTPELPSWPRLKYIMPLAVLLGLALSVGLAFLRELLNDTVRSPRDVSRVGHLNLLGTIADQTDDPQVEDAKLAIFDAPQSATAEQFRQARTRLQYALPIDSARSILVTGPGAGDGKSTVAANLAAGLALNGRRILLVDANFRKPELHRLFGISNEGGFSEVLNGALQLSDAAKATRVPNLSLLTSGARPANAAELMESRLLSEFIDHATEEYDHVIFDSAPFLVVAESQAMAPRVDGVVTVVRAHVESRGMLQRMRDALRQLRAEHIGVVLNAVRAQGGGYYRRNIKAFYRYNNGR